MTEILIYGDIGEWGGTTGVTAGDVAEALRRAGPQQPVVVRINSYGGQCFDGLAIYNALRRHQARVTVEIDGIAASSASLIAMAGKPINIAQNAMFMLHDAWGVVSGDADALEKRARELREISGIMARTYSSRRKLPLEVVQQQMRAETWFSAAEAVAAGYVDAIIDERRVAALAIPNGRFRAAPIDRLRSVNKDNNEYRRAVVVLRAAAARRQRQKEGAHDDR